jgi:hypothetical protein
MTDAPTNIDESSPKKSRRRYGWWLFFALVVLLFAAGLPIAIRSQRQISLIDRLEKAGGQVFTKPVGPEWLRDFLSEDRMRGFDDMTCVFVDPQTANESIKEIANLTDLEVLVAGDTQVNDSDLQCLKGLTHLEVLTLDHTHITDEGVQDTTCAPRRMH